VSSSFAISARKSLQLWQIWTRVEDSILCSWQGKHTAHVGERGNCRGKKPYEWRELYESVRKSFIHVRELQWEQSRTCAGCSGNSRVCTRFLVGTVMYICTWFLGRSRSIQTNVNSHMANVSRSYKRSATNLWAEEISRDSLRFDLLIFLVIVGQGCPQILVTLYWLRGLLLPSEFLKLTKVTE